MLEQPGWDGGLDELAVELPGLLECLDPVLLQASSLLLQQLYNFGLVGDMVILWIPWAPHEAVVMTDCTETGIPEAGIIPTTEAAAADTGTGPYNSLSSVMGLNKYLGAASG